MDRNDVEALRERLESLLRQGMDQRDPAATITGILRPDGKLDVTVVSEVFEGMDALEREALVWPLFASVPKPDLVRMTYCLLLTPGEALRNFASRNAE